MKELYFCNKCFDVYNRAFENDDNCPKSNCDGTILKADEPLVHHAIMLCQKGYEIEKCEFGGYFQHDGTCTMVSFNCDRFEGSKEEIMKLYGIAEFMKPPENYKFDDEIDLFLETDDDLTLVLRNRVSDFNDFEPRMQMKTLAKAQLDLYRWAEALPILSEKAELDEDDEDEKLLDSL